MEAQSLEGWDHWGEVELLEERSHGEELLSLQAGNPGEVQSLQECDHGEESQLLEKWNKD